MQTLTLNVPTHATHVVCDPEGEIVAWATTERMAMALLERQPYGAYVATHVEASREEAIRELEALNAYLEVEDPSDAFERVLEQAGLTHEGCDHEVICEVEELTRVTQAVSGGTPAKLTIGFTAGGNLAQRSRRTLRRAGITLPTRISERSIRKAVREAGFTPEIVPASTL